MRHEITHLFRVSVTYTYARDFGEECEWYVTILAPTGTREGTLRRLLLSSFHESIRVRKIERIRPESDLGGVAFLRLEEGGGA